MSKFTPGPWRVGRPGSVVADTPVPEMSGSDAVDYYGGHMVAESVVPRNARLIAASPELLEALRLLVSIYDQNTTGYLVEDAFNKARDVIAKATSAPDGN